MCAFVCVQAIAKFHGAPPMCPSPAEAKYACCIHGMPTFPHWHRLYTVEVTPCPVFLISITLQHVLKTSLTVPMSKKLLWLGHLVWLEPSGQ
jgi:hypothetical protein